MINLLLALDIFLLVIALAVIGGISLNIFRLVNCIHTSMHELFEKLDHKFEQIETHRDWSVIDIQDTVKEQHKLTRERIAQVKTRLSDDEKDDQRAKARQRYHKHHGGHK